MSRAFAAELTKLRTVRYPWVVLLVSELLVVAGVSGLAMSSDSLDGQVPKALAHTGLVALCSLVLGIFAVAGEYRHGTITDTYLSEPRRTRPLAAKLAVTSIVAFGIGLLAAATGVAVTVAWWQAKGADFSMSSAAWETLVGGVLGNILYAALGVALGAVVRSLVGAVALALGWVFVIEGIVGQLVGEDAARWLPFAAGQSLARMGEIGTTGQLSQGVAGVVLFAYVAILGVAAGFVTLNRDVT